MKCIKSIATQNVKLDITWTLVQTYRQRMLLLLARVHHIRERFIFIVFMAYFQTEKTKQGFIPCRNIPVVHY